MEYLLYFIGFTIALAAFFYTIYGVNWGKNKIRNIAKPRNTDAQTAIKVEPQKISNKNFKWLPGERICPLCGSVLTKSDALYASQIDTPKGQKILILGCRFCYDLDDEQNKKP